jgi:EmrB/QacA subfamily drug resistance transporter
MTEISNVRKWGSLAVLTLALAIIIIDTTLINVSLRTIVVDLHTTVHSLQWVITGYALTLSAFTIAGGRLGDLFGRKRMFMLGAVTFACGSLTAATAHSVLQLMIGASFIEGLGAAMMLPATASLLLATFQGRERAIAFGVWGGVAGAAASIGPLLGGYLTTYYSWHYGYGINIAIVTVLLLFSWLVVDSRENLRRPSIDFIGIFLSSLGLASLVYGIVQSSTDGLLKAKDQANIFGHALNLGAYSFVPVALAFGVALLIMFGLWEAIVELRGKTPLVSLKLLSTGPFVAGIVTLAIVAMGQFGILFTLPVFLQGVRGLDAFHTGLAFLPFSLTTLLIAPLSGVVVSKLRVPPKYVIMTGLVVDAIGLYLLHNAITPSATVGDLRVPFIVFGAGFGMAFANLQNVTLSAVSVRVAGEAAGVNNTARQLGATMGNAIIGSVLIAALTSNVTAGVQGSGVIPNFLKPKIEAGISTQVQSLGQGSPTESNGHPLPPAITAELTRISSESTARAVRHAVSYAVVILGFGVLASLWLPRGGDHGELAEAAQTAADVGAAPDPPLPEDPVNEPTEPRESPIPVTPPRPHRHRDDKPSRGPIRL